MNKDEYKDATTNSKAMAAERGLPPGGVYRSMKDRPGVNDALAVREPKSGEADILAKYANELQKIYDKRTAGDYTFLGVLAAFAIEWENHERSD
jgi:hypothetical protein